MSVLKILGVAVVTGSMTTLTPLSPALQAQQTCFLQGANGQHVDLGYLCGDSKPSQPSAVPAGVFQVPIKRREAGIPVVEVTFNGKHTFEMMFDTGASGITITQKMAKTIGVKPERGGFSSTAGGTIPIEFGRVSTVKVGALVSKNLEVSINPALPDIGLLGQSFYGHYDITIKQKAIELRAR